MLEYFVLLILLFGFIVAGVTCFTSWRYNKQLASRTLTRGMNGLAGKTIPLQCPSGQTISVFKAHYVCTSGGPTEDKNCDPYWQVDGQKTDFFNPANTIDMAATIANSCNGKQTCSWAIPTNIGICGTTKTPCNGELQLIGTYDCVPS